MTKLAIFFLDAIRFQDLNQRNTPFLDKMASDGISGPLGTLLAYEGLAATLFTGTFPSEHGVWTRYYRDPERSPFKWIGPFSQILDRFDASSTRAAKPLRYGLMRLSNVLAGISYFPGTDEVPLRELARMNPSLKRNLFESYCFGRIPSLFDILRQTGLSFHYFDHGLFDSDADVERRALSDPKGEVAVVRFVDLDTASHEYGLGTTSMLESLKRTDLLVDQLVSRWRQQSPELSVLCFADHGMISVKATIDIGGYLRDAGFHAPRGFGMFLDSTMARFWSDPQTLLEVRSILSELKSGIILSNSDLERYHLPVSPNWANLVFLANPGFVISPNFFDRFGKTKAMHGYDPETPGLDTIAILNTPNGKGHRHLERVQMIDILPTALDLLGLKTPTYCQGTSMLAS